MKKMFGALDRSPSYLNVDNSRFGHKVSSVDLANRATKRKNGQSNRKVKDRIIKQCLEEGPKIVSKKDFKSRKGKPKKWKKGNKFFGIFMKK